MKIEIEKFDIIIKEKEEKIKKLNNENEELKTQIVKYKKKLETDKKNYENKINQLNNKISKNDYKILFLEKTLDQHKKNNLSSVNDYNRLMEKFSAQMNQLKESNKNIKVDKDLIEKLKKEKEELENKIKENKEINETDIVNLVDQLIENNNKEKEDNNKDVNKFKEEINKIKNEKEILEKKLNVSENKLKIIKEEMGKQLSEYYIKLFQESLNGFRENIYKIIEEKQKYYNNLYKSNELDFYK